MERAFKGCFSVNLTLRTPFEVVPSPHPRKIVATLPMLFVNLRQMVNLLLLLWVSQLSVQLVFQCYGAQNSKGRIHSVVFDSSLAQVVSKLR